VKVVSELEMFVIISQKVMIQIFLLALHTAGLFDEYLGSWTFSWVKSLWGTICEIKIKTDRKSTHDSLTEAIRFSWVKKVLVSSATT
jgi:hypothetical protein